jgi:uncharacterized membrane protein (DUF373 family)
LLEKSTSKKTASVPPTSIVRRALDGGEELIYVVVAGLLLIAAAAACGYAAFSAVRQLVTGSQLEAIFSLVNDLLLVLIIMEVLRTVARFIRKRELNVDVQDIVPFLVIAAISGARRILAIGANLSLNEVQHSQNNGSSPGPTADWDRFDQAMIEIGVNTGLIIVITVALLVIHRYTLGRFQGQEN